MAKFIYRGKKSEEMEPVRFSNIIAVRDEEEENENENGKGSFFSIIFNL